VYFFICAVFRCIIGIKTGCAQHHAS
jgi:hypothetical protein